jgi:two-component system probable response regulator PhcQ
MNFPQAELPTILFVDDEATAVKYFQRAIGALAPVLTAGSVEEGRQVLDANADRIAVLVSDQRMPGAYGNELLFYARDRYPDMVRILTTAYSEIEHTVEAVNQGQIHRYIQKPWEIVALRMELKQALALAQLKREHAQLLRDKLQVGQQHLLANRLGALATLFASLAAPEQQLTLDACLGAAHAAAAVPATPDWGAYDYAELVALEAWRNAGLREAVHQQLARMERLHPYSEPGEAIDVLAALLNASRPGTGELLLSDSRLLAEYLESGSEAALSPQFAGWLACLVWLGKRGWTLDVNAQGDGVHCSLLAAGSPMTPLELAAWTTRFDGVATAR